MVSHRYAAPTPHLPPSVTEDSLETALVVVLSDYIVLLPNEMRAKHEHRLVSTISNNTGSNTSKMPRALTRAIFPTPTYRRVPLGDPALQMQMVTGTRGGGALGLIFRGSLWRDSEATCLMAVETLHRRLLRNRRVSRRAKADFFSSGAIEHLRKVSFGVDGCSCCGRN